MTKKIFFFASLISILTACNSLPFKGETFEHNARIKGKYYWATYTFDKQKNEVTFNIVNFNDFSNLIYESYYYKTEKVEVGDSYSYSIYLYDDKDLSIPTKSHRQLIVYSKKYDCVLSAEGYEGESNPITYTRYNTKKK